LALDLFGGIDILVQNAGITQRSLVKTPIQQSTAR